MTKRISKRTYVNDKLFSISPISQWKFLSTSKFVPLIRSFCPLDPEVKFILQGKFWILFLAENDFLLFPKCNLQNSFKDSLNDCVFAEWAFFESTQICED